MVWFGNTRSTLHSSRASRAALRRRAAARERARIGRDLHDGVMQGLIAIDMQLEAACRSDCGHPRDLADTVESVQARLRAEVMTLRALVEETRSSDVAPSQLTAAIDEVVWRFNRGGNIAAACFMPPRELAIRLPRRVCSELVRIVREALTNVRRHSGAGNVVVALDYDAQQFTLSIADDGRGFAGRRPPGVLSERAAAIGGFVTLTPVARGSRVVVTISREGPWKHSASYASSWRTTIQSFVMG